MSMGGCLLLLRFSMKRVSIKDQNSFSPTTCVSTLVVKLVVVGGERNPASLVPSFRVRGRELEGNPTSRALPQNWLDERPNISSIGPETLGSLPAPYPAPGRTVLETLCNQVLVRGQHSARRNPHTVHCSKSSYVY